MVFGTFDQLHIGHKEYIARAFELAENVLIMVMSDEASRPTKIYTPYTFEIRCQQILNFASTKGWQNNRLKLDTWHERPELYGRMLEEPLVDVVLTGHEYLDRTYEMFQERARLGLPQFTLVLHPRHQKDGKEITSTSIRMSLETPRN
jgi:cytidyltransferase-like protein